MEFIGFHGYTWSDNRVKVYDLSRLAFSQYIAGYLEETPKITVIAWRADKDTKYFVQGNNLCAIHVMHFITLESHIWKRELDQIPCSELAELNGFSLFMYKLSTGDGSHATAAQIESPSADFGHQAHITTNTENGEYMDVS